MSRFFLFFLLMPVLLCAASTVDSTSTPSFRTIKRLERDLHNYDHNYSRQTQRLLKKLSRQENQLLLKDSLPKNDKRFAIIQADHRERLSRIDRLFPADTLSHKNRAERKSRYLLNIRRYNLRIQACNVTNRQISAHKQSLASHAERKSKQNAHLFTQMDKAVFYGKVRCRFSRNAFAGKVKKQLIGSELDQAKQQAANLSSSIAKAGPSALPTDIQSKKSVLSSMPQNKAGVSSGTRASLNDNMQQSLSKFDQMKAGAFDPEDLKDSISFVPNPYRGRPFVQRLKPGMNWQFNSPLGNTPAVADLACTLGFLLNAKTTPFIGASYRLGFGSLEQVRFSHQGYSLRGGIDYFLLAHAGISGSYECSWLRNNAVESATAYRTRHAAIAGVFYRSGNAKHGMKLMIGYNLLSLLDHTIPQPLVLRMGIE